MSAETISIAIEVDEPVSGLWQKPPGAKAVLVLGHGAGAGMAHKGMAAIADGLEARGVATLRYNFPYMERGSKRPDSPKVAHATVRAAVREAHRLAPKLPLIAGGRSFGGRMTSQAQAAEPLAQVAGLAFFAFPLHPAGKPATDRADHLAKVAIPMLFLQGTRDELAEIDLLKGVTKALGKRATVKLIDDVDHSFHIPAKSGRKDPEVMSEFLDSFVEWMAKLAP